MKDYSLTSGIELVVRMRDEVNDRKRRIEYRLDCKKELLTLKWACEQALEQCELIEGEQDFIRTYEHVRLLDKIRGKQ